MRFRTFLLIFWFLILIPNQGLAVVREDFPSQKGTFEAEIPYGIESPNLTRLSKWTRMLTQSALQSADSLCELSESVKKKFYNAQKKTWTVNQALLDETKGELGVVLNCSESGDTLRIAAQLRLNVTSAIRVRFPLSFLGETSEDSLPLFTCSSRNTIFVIELVLSINAFAKWILDRNVKNVVFRNLKFMNCTVRGGSPIEIKRAEVTIRECEFESNKGSNGGSISASAKSMIVIQNSRFVQNRAYRGGAIFIESTATLNVSKSNFSSNAIRSNSRQEGGAIFAENDDALVELVFAESLFKENNGTNGGALFLSGNYQTKVRNCSFFQNSAIKNGGSISVSSSNRPSSNSNSKILADCAISDSAFEFNIADSGGAIAFLSGTQGSLEKVDFKNNSAERYGGALFIFSDSDVVANDCRFFMNEAKRMGGAIGVVTASSRTLNVSSKESAIARFRMQNTECSRNLASCGGCLGAENETEIRINNTMIHDNEAFEGNGDFRFGNGGGICLIQNRRTEINHTHVENNTAIQGGGIFVGSSLFANDTIFVRNMDRFNLSIMNSSFVGNEASHEGGGIKIDDFLPVFIVNSTFWLNKANSSGGGMDVSPWMDKDENRRPIVFQSASTKADFQSRLLESLNGSVVQELSDPTPLLPIELINVLFLSNSAGLYGGGIAGWTGSLIVTTNASFASNTASNGGGGFIESSTFSSKNCSYYDNRGLVSGAGLFIQTNSTKGLEKNLPAEGVFRSSRFFNNTSGSYGGAIVLQGRNAHLNCMENVSFEKNFANTDGGNSKPDLFLISLDRRGTETGGALALTFLYDRQDNVTFENTVFRQNQARKGGAMSAVYYSQAADDGIFTDISPIKLSNTSFSKNKAEDGGAIFFRGLVASLSNVRIANNAAQEKGGGILLEGSAMRMESSVLTSNRAKDGAGMQLGEGCSFYGFNCTFLENVAQEHGGGVSLTTWSNERQTVSYQFDNCRFKENKGNFGGGLHVTNGRNSESKPQESANVVLKGTVFSRNEAIIGGGAIFVQQPEDVAFSCLLVSTKRNETSNLQSLFLSSREVSKLELLSKKNLCSSWKNNQVQSGGYGDQIAGYAIDTKLKSTSKDNAIKVNRAERNPQLPTFHILLFDAFNQSFAEPQSDRSQLILSLKTNEEVEISGQRETVFQRGKATLDGVFIRGFPGNYSLNLTFSDDRIADIRIQFEILPCPIGWTSIANDQDCQKCEAGTYHFESNATECMTCPEGGICRFWGISPDKNYWLPFPCSNSPYKCPLKRACDYGEREQELEDFFDTREPKCNLSPEDWSRFRQIQCQEGYTGVLCGSCEADWGRTRTTCRECYSFATTLVYLLITIAWPLGIVVICIKGVLGKAPIEAKSEPRTSSGRQRISFSSRVISSLRRNPFPLPDYLPEEFVNLAEQQQNVPEIQVADTEGNRSRTTSCFSMVPEPASDEARGRFVPNAQGQVVRSVFNPQPSRNAFQSTTTEAPARVSSEWNDRYDAVKRQIAEAFKVFINFAQICSLALIIDAKWSFSIRGVLLTLDFMGVVSGETAASLECLFPESLSLPRSLSQEILALALPFGLYLICVLFWMTVMRQSPVIRMRRIVLTLIVILYICYVYLLQRMVRALYCIAVEDGTSSKSLDKYYYWIEDTSVQCYQGGHAYVALIGVLPMIVLIAFAFPMSCVYILLKKRSGGTLRNIKNTEMFGFLFRSFRDEFVFWDGLVMFRKALLVLVVHLGYALETTLQCAIASFILFVSVLLQVYLNPYSEKNAVLNHFEIFSLSISGSVFVSGILLNDDNVNEAARFVVSAVVLAGSIGFIFAIFSHIYILMIKLLRFQLEGSNVLIEEQEICGTILYRWIRFRLAQVYIAFKKHVRPAEFA